MDSTSERKQTKMDRFFEPGKIPKPIEVATTENAKLTRPFIITRVAVLILGLLCVCFTAALVVVYFGGLKWNDGKVNYHALFMVLGLTFLYANAILVYRTFPNQKKMHLKIMHAALHVGSIIFVIVALTAIVESKKQSGSAHLYSIHSWLGVSTVILYALQYFFGFAFLIPRTPLKIRKFALPYHTFLGTGVFVLCIATTLMGLATRLGWVRGYNSGTYPTAAIFGNLLGLFLVIHGFLVVYLLTKDTFKRKPKPEELDSSYTVDQSVNL